MNNATFIGNLTADAVQRPSANGNYITFGIAVNERRKDSEVTTYIDCIKSGDNAALLPYLTKGSKVCVIGRVAARAYIDKEGQPQGRLDLNVYQLELCGSKAQTAAPATAAPAANIPAPERSAQIFPERSEPTNDLPF